MCRRRWLLDNPVAGESEEWNCYGSVKPREPWRGAGGGPTGTSVVAQFVWAAGGVVGTVFTNPAAGLSVRGSPLVPAGLAATSQISSTL